MRTTPHTLTLVMIAAVALVASLPGGCGCVGCTASFGWSAVLPPGLTDADIGALMVRVCRNGQCTQGSVDTNGRVRRVGGASVSVPAGGRTIQVGWQVSDPANGDRYAIEVTDPRGTLVVGLAEQAVTYSEYRANGAFDPNVCHSATVEGNTIDGGRSAMDSGSVDAR